MLHRYLTTTALAICLGGGINQAAQAQSALPDPLLGYCAAGAQCIDNGTNSPTTDLSNFGFVVDPKGLTGTLYLDFLVPNNEQAGIASIGLTGSIAGTATLFNVVDWTTGTLSDYLSMNASPNNPLGAYLPSTQAFDPTAIGFSVYQADLGVQTLFGSANPNISPLENIDTALPAGSYVVGFLEGTTKGNIATANSGAIFCTNTTDGCGGGGGGGPGGGPGGNPIPEPFTIGIFGTSMIGLAWARRSGRKVSGR